jgi:hypothetical protein
MLPREFWPKKVEKSDALRTMVQDRKDAAVEAIAARVPRVPQGKRHGSLRHLCGLIGETSQREKGRVLGHREGTHGGHRPRLGIGTCDGWPLQR